jgi:CheY-like chemotaxis protein
MGDGLAVSEPVLRSAGQAPRVLVAEDEMLVALFIADMLAEFGYRLAGVVSRLEEAMAHPADYDLAVLDVHLNGRPVFDFADRLAERGTPFVFATGYGARGIPERHRDRPVLQKPYMPENLKQALDRLTGRIPA